MRARRINLVLGNRSYVINGLRVAWIALVLWFELGLFKWSLIGCNWPDTIWQPNLNAVHAFPAHLLVIADTQVLDSDSLPSIKPWFRRLVHFITDSNLRKSWSMARNLKPDGVLFLGDMINGGRYARSDEEYQTFAAQFKDLFTLPSTTPAYYVVGNHDVGLGRSTQFSQRARARFETSFNVSQLNRVVEFGNHSLVLIDSPGLVEEDYRRVKEDNIYPLRSMPGGGKKGSKQAKQTWTPSAGGPMEFIKSVTEERQTQPNPPPLILFSHIPLARPERHNCGPLREGQGAQSYIQKGAGLGYQNLLGKATTQWLLETLEPNAVFTADDHDYCEVTHFYLGGGMVSGVSAPSTAKAEQGHSSPWSIKIVKEITVKAFSMNTGIRHPGLQLISLWNPTSSDLVLPPDVDSVSATTSPNASSNLRTFADKACLLPDQEAIYFHGYLPLSLLSLALIAWLNLKFTPPHPKISLVTPRNKSLPFFNTPGYSRLFDTPPTIDDQDDTPRGHEMGRTTSRQGLTSYPSASGLRTPVSRGGSPFPSPLLSPILVPHDMDDDSDDGGDDDGTPTSHGGTRVRGGTGADEEKGFTSAIGSRGAGAISSPKAHETSYSFPSSPTPRSGKWGRGGTRSFLGQAGLGIGLGVVGGDREREKASEVGRGWRRIQSGAGSRFGRRAVLSCTSTMARWSWSTLSGIVLGRSLRPSGGVVNTFWMRCMWDALCVAFSSWLTFGLVTWWFIW